MYVGSVVIDCNDFPAMLAFWQQALRYVLRDPPEEDFAILRDPQEGTSTSQCRSFREKRIGKNRLHLDLYTDNQEEEVRRLLDLGATLHPRTPEPGEDFILLEDPEGNVFCVVDTAGR